MIDINKKPKPSKLPELNFAKPNIFQLNNGVKVFVIENHDLPTVQVELKLDNPITFFGKQKGAVKILNKYLGNYAQKYDKEYLNDRFDFMATDYWVNADGFGFNCLSRYFEESFKLIVEYFLHPKFDRIFFETEQTKVIELLKSKQKDVNEIALKTERKLIFGDNHPFGEVVEIEDVQNTVLEDIIEVYKQLINPNFGYLLVKGQVSSNEVKTIAQTCFANWINTLQTNDTKYDIPIITTPQINLIDLPYAQQAIISVVSTTHYTMNNPDFFALQLANLIFGGTFNSRLNMNLREHKGLTYGVNSSISPSRYVSKFKISTKVKPQKVREAIAEILYETERMYTEKVSDEELNLAKNLSIGYFVMNAEKPEVVLNQTYYTAIFELPEDFYQSYINNIHNVSADDIMRVVHKYFNRNKTNIIITGKADIYKKEIKQLNMPVVARDI